MIERLPNLGHLFAFRQGAFFLPAAATHSFIMSIELLFQFSAADRFFFAPFFN
jgi:hypothetical protein